MPDITKGVELFNNNRYFEAHDFFEELWKYSESQDRLFLQGLIQISVGSYHVINRNTKGALNQFTKGINKLESYKPVYHKLDIQNVLDQVHRLIAILNSEENYDSDCCMPVLKLFK